MARLANLEEAKANLEEEIEKSLSWIADKGVRIDPLEGDVITG